MQSEIFGPVLPIMDIGGLDAAIEYVKSGPKPLAAYLFSSDGASGKHMVESVSAGSVCLNDVMVFMAVDELPFGGVGASGTGNYKGASGFRQLSHNKAVLKRTSKPDWRMRYAPMDRTKMKWLRKFR
jgi:aldehyde dehydrogenase (NAD+)